MAKSFVNQLVICIGSRKNYNGKLGVSVLSFRLAKTVVRTSKTVKTSTGPVELISQSLVEKCGGVAERR
jgi:hypothetical protein